MSKLDDLRSKWRWLDILVGVHERFGEVQGATVASSITVSVFLSLFPLLLVAISVVGFIAAGDANAVDNMIDGLGLSGGGAEVFTNAIDNAVSARGASLSIGLVGAAWSALGVASALQLAANVPWQATSIGWKDKVKAVVFLAGGAVLFAASFVLSGLVSYLPAWAAPLTTLLGAAVFVAILLWLYWFLCSHHLPVRAFLPGALLGALAAQILTTLGTTVVKNMVADSSSLYGPIGAVFAVLAWLAIFAQILLYSSCLNVVMWERRHGTVTLLIEVPRVDLADRVVHTTRGGGLEAPKPPRAPRRFGRSHAPAATHTGSVG